MVSVLAVWVVLDGITLDSKAQTEILPIWEALLQPVVAMVALLEENPALMSMVVLVVPEAVEVATELEDQPRLVRVTAAETVLR